MGRLPVYVIIPILLSIFVALFSDLISQVAFSSWYGFLLVLCGLFICLLPVLFVDTISAAFQSRGPWRIAGKWFSDWHYDKNGDIYTVKDEVYSF